MLKQLVEFVATGFQSLRTPRGFIHRDIYGRVVEHADEFFHPVKFRGIPVFDAESILEHYKPQLDRLRDVVDIGDHRKTPDGKPLFDELYLKVLYRFIAYSHMIPASEDHHHAYTGGLLTHSIEASIEALRWSREMKCQITHMPDQDAKIKPIIDYCAWLGALMHDVGKIMRDISVDAVEVIHPLTKRPVPLSSPIVSWYPQKQSLTEWARLNHISAYSVTWLRHRTHNRHNIDSGQILTPLLQGTYALDYILSSPIKQELYSELVRCLSGYTHQKGHISDCMRMGDSVSTNKALSIQYDPVRGTRRISTATKLYQCINHARKNWEWNRPKSEGWLIGGEAYIRWSSSIDSIVSASVDLQYGLPTDTRNILTIMEQNGFTHLFDSESPNDRIVKFTPGNFKEDQLKDIVSGKQPVSWIDLIKVVTPHVVFGENPAPPSMTGVIFLPNAKSFFYINKDGDIIPLQADAHSELTIDSTPAATSEHNQPALPNPQAKPASEKNKVTNQEPAKKTKAVANQQGKKTDKEPRANTQANAPAKRKEPSFTPALPKAGKPSTQTDLLFDEDSIDDDRITNQVINQYDDYFDSHKEAPFTQSVEQGASISNNDSSFDTNTHPIMNNDAPNTSIMDSTTETSNTENPPVPEEEVTAPAINFLKTVKLSDTLQSILEKNPIFYKTKRDILLNADDVESKMKRPLSEILKDLKQANELMINPTSPSILAAFHVIDGQRTKCIALSFPLTKLFSSFSEGAHNLSLSDDQQMDKAIEKPAPSKKDKPQGEVKPVPANNTDAPSVKDKIAFTRRSETQSVKDASDKAGENSNVETPSIPASSFSLTHDKLTEAINKETAHRADGHVYLELSSIMDTYNVSEDDAFDALKALGALHICALEPVPEIIRKTRNKKKGAFVKLSEKYASLLPARKQNIVVEEGKAKVESPAKEQSPAPVLDDFTISLNNLAKTCGEKSLVHFLVSRNRNGLITYQQDGNLVIQLSAIPVSELKPMRKNKLMNALKDVGASASEGIFVISQSNLEKLFVEDIV